MKHGVCILLVVVLMTSAELGVLAASTDDTVERARRIAEEVKAKSFPQLRNTEIIIRLFDSRTDYFQTRFTFPSFLFGKRLKCLMKVNRKVFADNIPEEGLRAIIAHELGHALYYQSRHRLKLLGLVRLLDKDFAARFERATDLRAIALGYGDGLKTYRRWLYANISPNKLSEKKRDYFSPEEIDAVQSKLCDQPKLIELWLRRPPRSLAEIEAATISRIFFHPLWALAG
ncbi:MAG: hypothetical protein JST85_04475 [Acidobacteria bacterium]|nr:hypothetical protein [Acidobacteriota bacterium]